MFVYHPEPSPTSTMGINVRFYRIENDYTKESVDWDIGPTYETAIEAMYEQVRHEDALTPKQFEKLMRDLVQTRALLFVSQTTLPLLVATALGKTTDLVEQTMKYVLFTNRLNDEYMKKTKKEFGKTPELKGWWN